MQVREFVKGSIILVCRSQLRFLGPGITHSLLSTNPPTCKWVPVYVELNKIIFSSVVYGYETRTSLPTVESSYLIGLNRASKKPLNSPCIETITCGSETFVAKCTSCDPRYFYCKQPGATPLEKRCSSGQLFNPDPLYPRCILQANCPYHPPWTAPTTVKTPATEAQCVDTIICSDEPFVAKCTVCDPRYFYCKGPGATPVEKRCSSGKLFNPDPLFAGCILTDNCPYHPPWTLPTTKSTTTTTTTTTTLPTTTTTTTKATTTTTTTRATTTTTATTPTTKTTTTPFSGCLDTLECEATGDYAKCNYCQDSYFHCKEAGLPGAVMFCKDDEAFNIDPAFPACVPSSNCPFHPSTPISSPGISTTNSAETSSTTAPECWDSFDCPREGDFPKCIFCYEEYYHCTGKGKKGIQQSCEDRKVFNTVEGYPYCLSRVNCPYDPDSL